MYSIESPQCSWSSFEICWQKEASLNSRHPKYMLSSYCIHKKHLLTNGPSTNFSCFRTPTSPRGCLFSLSPIQIQAGGQLDRLRMEPRGRFLSSIVGNYH